MTNMTPIARFEPVTERPFLHTPAQTAESSTSKAIKSVVDIAFAFVGLLLMMPLLLLCAAAIKLDSDGPCLFRQRRHGLGGKPFTIFKFRTMHVLEDDAHIVQVTDGDVRVTRIGKVLRRTSLDELPQLLNVLRGEMSLVGPRPHAAVHDQYYSAVIPAYGSRFSAKPGITGWAQVNGARGETPEVSDMERRVELDLWYIDNWTLALDLRIIAITLAREIFMSTQAR